MAPKTIWLSFVKSINRIGNLGMILSAFCIAFTICLVTLEVFLRNVFTISTMVSDELSGYLLVATLFFGIAYCKRTGGLVRIEMVLDRLSPKGRALVEATFYVPSIWYIIVLLTQVCKYVIVSFTQHSVSVSSLHMPLYIPQSVMVIGLAILVLQMIIDFVTAIQPLFVCKKS